MRSPTPEHPLRLNFRAKPLLTLAAAFVGLIVIAILAAPWIAPADPFRSGSLNLADGFTPPVTRNPATGQMFWLGADDQGRDVLAALIHGARTSLFVGLCAVCLSALIGVSLGLISGYCGGWLDALIMRVGDVQLALPPILTALLIYGVARGFIAPAQREAAALWVLILAIGLSEWVTYARTVRGIVAVERRKAYVDAARVIGVSPWRIMTVHILPSASGPIVAIATLGLSSAIVAEATLSFLGVGVSPTQPSLGTLIRFGQQYLFSGEWWIVLFPALTLFGLALSINLIGDPLHDALDPTTRRGSRNA